MNEGWIKLYRGIVDNPIWNTGEVYTKGQAFIDLILRANFKDTTKIYKNTVYELKRGDYATSEKALADRWKWSRVKVRNFLKLLESQSMISQKKDTFGTVITIENYSKYQDEEIKKDTEKTSKKHQENIDETSKKHQENIENTHNKNEKKEKNEKNDKKEKKREGETPPRSAYGTFSNVFLTDADYGKLKRDYPDYYATYIEQLSEYINGYAEAEKKYKNHYSVLTRWMGRDGIKNVSTIKKDRRVTTF